MIDGTEIRALLVTDDPRAVEIFTDLFQEFGVDAQLATQVEGVPEELSRMKYEALLIDFDAASRALTILDFVRKSPSNRNAVVLAIANDAAHRQQALEKGANFAFERPLLPEEIRNVLRGAYDVMVGERRRYFRCSAELPVLLTRKPSGADLRCTTINISSSGMALSTPCPLAPGEDVVIVLLLQGIGLTIRTSGTVVWDDKHGKSGISFECTSSEMQRELDSWLGTQFSQFLSSRRHHVHRPTL
jgi:CheY-like chemotaxis protein